MVVFQDEVHFYQSTTVCRSWAIKGTKPTVNSAPGRNSISYSGFVIPSTGELFTYKTDWFNYETFIDTLRLFIEDNKTSIIKKKFYVFIDNAPWHKKAYRLIHEEDADEYSDIRKYITLVLLPTYSPDLNPIEQCWRITRREVTHNHYFPSLASLQETLDQYFFQFTSPNEKFKTLCSFSCYEPGAGAPAA